MRLSLGEDLNESKNKRVFKMQLKDSGSQFCKPNKN